MAIPSPLLFLNRIVYGQDAWSCSSHLATTKQQASDQKQHAERDRQEKEDVIEPLHQPGTIGTHLVMRDN